MNLIVFLLVALPARYCVERLKLFKETDRNPVWAVELRKMDERIANKKSIIFNVDRPIEAMFYSSFTVYPFIPDFSQVKKVLALGYDAVIRMPDGTLKIIKADNQYIHM